MLSEGRAAVTMTGWAAPDEREEEPAASKGRLAQQSTGATSGTGIRARQDCHCGSTRCAREGAYRSVRFRKGAKGCSVRNGRR